MARVIFMLSLMTLLFINKASLIEPQGKSGKGSTQEHGYDVVFLGQWNISDPGYMELFDHWRGRDDVGDEYREQRYSVLLSTVVASPVADRGYVYQLEHPGQYLDDVTAMPIIKVTSQVVWPTIVQQIPYEVFNLDAICIPDGFYLPNQADGGLHIADVHDSWENVPLHTLTADPDNEWVYSHPLWYDMDDDGLIDVTGCRFRLDLTNETSQFITSQFVWSRQPENDAFLSPWETHVMRDDVCDEGVAGATLTTADGQVYDVIFTVGYYTRELMVFWTTHPEGLWTDNELIEERVIAQSLPHGGNFFDLKLADLNMDGNVDVLLTVKSPFSGKVLAYEIPEDFRFGNYTEHVLAEGFVPDMDFVGAGSPGLCQVFYPDEELEESKPWVVLSGDDDGNAYYLVPVSEDPDDWTYDTVQFVDEGPQTQVGSPAAVDTNGDGLAEIFIPSYTNHAVYLYTFQAV